MEKHLFDFLKKDNDGRESAEKKGGQTEFVKSLFFEENPFDNETPEEVVLYDRDGNEVPL